MSKKVLFSSAHNETILAWVDQSLPELTHTADRKIIIDQFKQELNNLRFQVARPKTYEVRVVKHGHRLVLEASYNSREFRNEVGGIQVYRKYYFFGKYLLSVIELCDHGE